MNFTNILLNVYFFFIYVDEILAGI